MEQFASNGLIPPGQARTIPPQVEDLEWIKKTLTAVYPIIPGINDTIPSVDSWGEQLSEFEMSPKRDCDLTSQEWLGKRDEILKWCLGEASTRESRPTLYSRSERELLSQAIHDTFSLIHASLDTDGSPRDSAMTFQHIGLVTFLLMTAKAPVDVVIAGLFHDMHELRFVDFSDEKISSFMCDRYGDRVNELVEAVTEPPKSSSATDFITRKTAVLQKILQAPTTIQGDAATILAASKIATLTDGLIYFKRKHTLNGWSSGSEKANVEAAEILLGELGKTAMNPSIYFAFARKVMELTSLSNNPQYKQHETLGVFFNYGARS